MTLRTAVMGVVTWLVALALAAGCTPHKVPLTLPSQGGPRWIELQTEHFTLWTDATSAQARQVLRKLEERRQIVARGMNRARQAERIFAIVFRSHEELRTYLPDHVLAFAWSNANPSFQPGLVLSAESYGGVINHELAHAISFALLEHQPRWLAEALATYFEMGEPVPGTRQVTIGLPSPPRLQLLRTHDPLSIRQLFACKRLACADDDFYAWSWALFAYLLEQHFDRMAIYLQSLQANKGDHDLAWMEAFGEASLEALDGALRAWVAAGEMRVVRFWLQPQAAPAVERPLRDVEILTGLSLLPYAMGDLEGSIRLADQALAMDRSYPLAWMMANARGLKISEEEARAVLAANPDDWRALQLLIYKLNDLGRSDEELSPLRIRMCELAAQAKLYCKGYGPEPELAMPLRPKEKIATSPSPSTVVVPTPPPGNASTQKPPQ